MKFHSAKVKALLFTSILSLVSSFSLASGAERTKEDKNQKGDRTISGFIDFNGYYDTRDFNTFTLNALANLPQRFQYFSNMNYSNTVGTTQNFDLNTFYAEQNIRWALPRAIPLDLTFQWVQVSGAGNDLGRFGVQWRPSNTVWLKEFFKRLHFVFFSINLHLLQTDFDPSPGWGWQVEYAYFVNLLPALLRDRAYLSGWLDHDMNYGGATAGDNHTFVTEHQLGIRLINWFFAVTEYRHNDFLTKKDGVGLGLEYKMLF